MDYKNKNIPSILKIFGLTLLAGILIPSKDAGEQRKKVQYGKKKKKQDQVPNQTNVPSEAAEIPGDQGENVCTFAFLTMD